MELSEVEVSVIIPVRNEHKYISDCLESILLQDYPLNKMEIIFIDGVSEDDTTEIIKEYMKEHTNIRLLSNPNKLIQYALNIGVKNSVGKYIIRMDAHAEFARDYISKCVEYLEKTGAVKVGGPMTVKGKNKLQKVIAASYQSPFALGGARHHKSNYEGYVEAVPWGAFKKDKLMKIGLYDERLSKTEDDDIHMRILNSRGKIYITPAIRGIYYPRSTYRALWNQYFQYGLWKVAVIRKHKSLLSITHLVPMFFVVSILLLAILSMFSHVAHYFLYFEIFMYTILNIYFSFSAESINRTPDKLRLMVVHFIIHTSYGLGFLMGLFKFWNFR